MRGRPDIRLLLADVDGTLVNTQGVLTEAARAAAGELRNAGVALAVTSGRPPRGMSMLVGPLALTVAIAGFNGGVLAKPDLSVIEAHALEPSMARRALDLVIDHGLDAWVYTQDEWLIRDGAAPHVAREAATVQFAARIVSSFTAAELSAAVKIVGVSDDADRVAACEAAARQALGEAASADRSQPYYLDITAPDANKGAVLTTLSGRLGIPADQIAAIGDMPSDVSMFRRSGFAIAMGNASDAVKAQASAVTDSNDNEGFAKAVRRLLLGSEGS